MWHIHVGMVLSIQIQISNIHQLKNEGAGPITPTSFWAQNPLWETFVLGQGCKMLSLDLENWLLILGFENPTSNKIRFDSF